MYLIPNFNQAIPTIQYQTIPTIQYQNNLQKIYIPVRNFVLSLVLSLWFSNVFLIDQTFQMINLKGPFFSQCHIEIIYILYIYTCSKQLYRYLKSRSFMFLPKQQRTTVRRNFDHLHLFQHLNHSWYAVL